MEKVRTGIGFSEEEKFEALRILAINGYNYSKTAKELSISRKTLIKWNDRYGKLPDVAKKKAEDLATVATVMVGNQISVLDKVKEVSLAALDRAKDLVVSEKDLNKVTNLINVLKDYANNPDESKQDGQRNSRMSITERLEHIIEIHKSHE